MSEYIVDTDDFDSHDALVGYIKYNYKELIRCKDCKYWKLERYVGGEGMACQFMPSDGNVNLTPPTGYCCWARRKEK